MSKISERVDDLLEMVLALRRELSEAGHRLTSSTPNFVQAIAAEPGQLGPQPLAQAYEEITPGLTVGFRKGAKPDLHLRVTPEGALDIALNQRSSSGWITLEMDWNPASFREKRQLTLFLRGTSPEPLPLSSVVRLAGADGTTADLPAQAFELGPEPAFHTVSFEHPGDATADPKSCRVILFCPVQPFAMTLTELSVR